MLMTEHNAIRNAGNGIAVVGLGGLFEYVNPAVVQMWGYSEDEFQDMPLHVLMGNMELLDKLENMESEHVHQVVRSSIDAMNRLGAIIHRLNAVNEYRTTPYVQGENEEGSRILKI